jgi:DNA-binding PadR family transcriptional regulator
MQQLELIEITYTEGLRGSVRKIVNITEKGRKLLEALMEIREAQ